MSKHKHKHKPGMVMVISIGAKPKKKSDTGVKKGIKSIREKGKPHLTWADSSKTVGWKNGVLNMQLDDWAADNPGGYTESISGSEEQ